MVDKSKGFIQIIIPIILAIVILAGIDIFVLTKNSKNSNSITCTMDAKICPDGSSVGRVPPNCDFTPCPSAKPTSFSDETANWKTYTSKFHNFSFKIPKQFAVEEYKTHIAVFLDQEALDKSKSCKPDPKDLEPLPCSPYLIDISYTKSNKDPNKSIEDYAKQGWEDIPLYKVQGSDLNWIVGPSVGLVERPTIKAYAYDKNTLHIIEANTYILPFWKYKHNLSSNSTDRSMASENTEPGDIDEFSYQILSTFKFLDEENVKNSNETQIQM